MSRKDWKDQWQIIEGNSKFHERVRQIIIADPFLSSLRCFQEVPVQDLCPDYPTGRHRLDWYIEDLSLVIELHGRQHYKFTNRGNVAYDQAHRDFLRSRGRDRAKKQSVLSAGYRFVEIPYKMESKLNGEKLKELIFK